MRSIREKALERLNRLGISTTQVVTVQRGVNDGEMGAIVDFALTQPAVRGVTLQPVQQAGRVLGFESARHRMTLTEVRRRILEQTGVFKPEDLIPVPCHPDSLAMAYAIKMNGKTVPLTGMLPPEGLIDGAKNMIVSAQEVGHCHTWGTRVLWFVCIPSDPGHRRRHVWSGSLTMFRAGVRPHWI
jgi:hypothetical protein